MGDYYIPESRQRIPKNECSKIKPKITQPMNHACVPACKGAEVSDREGLHRAAYLLGQERPRRPAAPP